MNLDNFNVEKDLSINQYNLDLEAISLPSIYFRYSDAVREAKEIVAEKKDNLEAILAEKNIQYREEASNLNLKVTEGVITAKINSDKDVLQAKKELRDANAVQGRLQVAVSALETKRNSIDNLVKLYCNAYYTNRDTKPNSDFKDEMIAHDMRNGTRSIPVND